MHILTTALVGRCLSALLPSGVILQAYADEVWQRRGDLQAILHLHHSAPRAVEYTAAMFVCMVSCRNVNGAGLLEMETKRSRELLCP